MAEEVAVPEKETDKKVVHVYPLVKYCDMNEEQRIDSIELAITACEKYASNYEQAARVIKEAMDKNFGVYWHVVVGEAFGYQVSYETKNILYLYFGGNLAILLFKCS